jgi:hypothetical protein
VVQILLTEAVVFGLLAILIPALMVMDTTTAEDMMAGRMEVVIVAVEMAEEDIDMRTLPPTISLEPTAFTPLGSRCGRRFTDGFRGRGSVLGR